MAVPKKKTSKMKKAKRRYTWRQVAMKAAERAFSIAIVALKQKESAEK